MDIPRFKDPNDDTSGLFARGSGGILVLIMWAWYDPLVPGLRISLTRVQLSVAMQPSSGLPLVLDGAEPPKSECSRGVLALGGRGDKSGRGQAFSPFDT